MYFGCKNLGAGYGKKNIIDNLTMEFPKGEISIVIGPNGCGKSTLLKQLSSRRKKIRGEVLLDEKPIQEYGAKSLARMLAYLPQIRKSPPDIDVKTLVSYGRYARKTGRTLRQKDLDIIDRSMEMAGVSDIANRLLLSLSGGERQRAWIAMTLCQEPEILLLDEPITHLDPSYQVEVMELLKTLQESLSMTLVLVLHDMNLAARYGHQIFAMKEGKLFQQGSPKEVIEPKILRELYGMDFRLIWDEKYDCPVILPDPK